MCPQGYFQQKKKGKSSRQDTVGVGGEEAGRGGAVPERESLNIICPESFERIGCKGSLDRNAQQPTALRLHLERRGTCTCLDGRPVTATKRKDCEAMDRPPGGVCPSIMKNRVARGF